MLCVAQMKKIINKNKIQDAKAPWYQPGVFSAHAQKICLTFPDKLQMLCHLKHWPSRCLCCHVLLSQYYQKENLQNPRITGWINWKGPVNQSSGPTSLLHQGHPRGHCTELHPDCSWIILGKSRNILALIHFWKPHIMQIFQLHWIYSNDFSQCNINIIARI